MKVLANDGISNSGIKAQDASTLQRLQNMGIKIVLQADRLAHTSEIHENINLPYLITRRDVNSATLMYKIDTADAPINTCNMFRKVNSSNDRQTRQSARGGYEIPKCRLELGKRNFRYRGAKIWKQVPEQIRKSESVKSFKKNLRKAWSGNYPNNIT